MKRRLGVTVAILGVLSMAPTSGDVGGCGREATSLDVDAYAAARKDEDCDRCRECGVTTLRCERACDPAALPDIAVPATCKPLRRDGEVCLRAIHAASCDDFAGYVDDRAPKTPSECEFCRIVPPPADSFGDGGG